MAYTAADVKNLRERTGAGMMDCKKALDETGGDFEALALSIDDQKAFQSLALDMLQHLELIRSDDDGSSDENDGDDDDDTWCTPANSSTKSTPTKRPQVRSPDAGSSKRRKTP